MPPWHIERNVGIQQFKDDPSLSDAEIATIASWVDAGAPRGNAGDMPPAPTFPDDEAWHIGKPDLIVEIPKPHVVPAAGADLWIDYIADSRLTEDRYLQAVEAKPGPGARAVVHHLLTYLIQDIDEDEVLAGRLDDRADQQRELPQRVRRRQERRHPARRHRQAGEGRIEDPLQPALSPVGQGDRRSRARRAEVLSEGLQAEVPPDLAADRQRARRARHPAEHLTRHDGYYRFSKPARVTAVQAHMHNRGKRMCVEAILPSGRAETLNCMYFDFNWHKVYNYADEVTPLLPAGTMLHTILWHDNTAEQPQQSRSAQLGRLRPADDRRDGVLVGDVDLPRRRRLQDDARRARSKRARRRGSGRRDA